MNPDDRVGGRRPASRLFAPYWPIGLVLILAASSALVGEEPGREITTCPVVEPRAGETCIVCEKAVGATDQVYEVEGQRVPVHAGACDDALRRAPEHYLARLKPRGAFLGAEPNPGPNISLGWFAFGTYILLGLVFGAICAYHAVNHALRPWTWFLAGFFLNVFGFLALVTRPAGDSSRAPAGLPPGLVKVPTTYSPRVCPRCGEMNHPSATCCVRCGNKIEPLVTSEVARVAREATPSGQASNR